MPAKLPLPTMLSQVLVALTIEFDNEAEHQMAHWTTSTGRAAGPRGATWLVSKVMWSNVMQYVGADGIRIGELRVLSRTTHDSLSGLQRWGYVRVKADPADPRTAPPRDDLVVHATAGGRRAQAVWRPLSDVLEERWRARFGPDAIARLRESLQAVVSRLGVELPEYLPVVYPTMNGKAEIPDPAQPAPSPSGSVAAGTTEQIELSSLLSKALLAFTIDFERESRISLPISANTLRVLDATGVRVRDLPHLTGVSKEANSMATGFLVRHGCAVVEPDPAATRGKVVRLTQKGERAQEKYRRLLELSEERWKERFGEDVVGNLRQSLERLVGHRGAEQPRLLQGLAPYPDGWRASVRPYGTLPHYPMVLHRGGYPDGS